MPRRRVHQAGGMTAGAVMALARSRPEDGAANLFVACGGALGGRLTSMLPDYFEPATCFNHRRFFHSATAGVGVVRLSAQAFTQWESCWRDVATRAQIKSVDLARSPAERALFFLIAAAAWVLVGLLAGLVAGFVSHLVLDLGDPSGLPLLGLKVRVGAV